MLKVDHLEQVVPESILPGSFGARTLINIRLFQLLFLVKIQSVWLVILAQRQHSKSMILWLENNHDPPPINADCKAPATAPPPLL